jgi:heptosyltransferase-2
MKKDFKNILIVRTDRIGDVILTTPAIAALRRTFKDARITAMVSPLTVELIDGNPYLDATIVDDRAGRHAGLRGFWRLVQDLRKGRYDLAIIFHTKRRTNLACFLAGIPHRLGYKNDKYGFLLNHPVADERPSGLKHESQYCLDLLTPLGVAGAGEKITVSIHPLAERWADEIFAKNGFDKKHLPFAVHMGASDPSKCWPQDNFFQVMMHILAGYGAAVLLVGGKETKAKAAALAARYQGNFFDFCGETSLSQLASLLKRCRMLISNDSGPVHVAAAVGTPVVSIFTRNQPGINPERWAPLEPRSRVVAVPPDTQPSFKKGGSATPDYLQKIKPAAVLEAVDAIYKLC